MASKINPYKVEAIKSTSEVIKRNFANIPEKIKLKTEPKESERPFSVYLEAAIQRINDRDKKLNELKILLNNPKYKTNDIKEIIATLNRGNIQDKMFLKSNGITDLTLLGQHFDFFA